MKGRTAGLCLAALGCTVLVLLVMTNEIRSGAATLPLADLRWQYVVASFACAVGLVIVYAIDWWLLMCRLERRRVSFGASARMFAISWPGRYLPGSFPHYAGRLVAAPAAGMSRSGVAASLAYENLITLAVGSVGAVVCLLLVATGRDWTVMWIALPLAVAVAALAGLHPITFRFAIELASSRIRRLAPLRSHVLSLSELSLVIAIHAVGYVLIGVAFYLSLRALGAAPSPLLAIGAYNLAGIAGILAIGVPGGLGVREAVVVALLGGAVGAPLALTAAVLMRIVSMLADCVPALLAVLWMVTERALRARATSQAVLRSRGGAV